MNNIRFSNSLDSAASASINSTRPLMKPGFGSATTPSTSWYACQDFCGDTLYFCCALLSTTLVLGVPNEFLSEGFPSLHIE